jgi:hypothetical protein
MKERPCKCAEENPGMLDGNLHFKERVLMACHNRNPVESTQESRRKRAEFYMNSKISEKVWNFHTFKLCQTCMFLVTGSNRSTMYRHRKRKRTNGSIVPRKKVKRKLYLFMFAVLFCPCMFIPGQHYASGRAKPKEGKIGAIVRDLVKGGEHDPEKNRVALSARSTKELTDNIM